MLHNNGEDRMSTSEEVELSATQTARREFMEKAGKLAVCTPPLMLGLIVPGAHAIGSGGINPGGVKPKKFPFPGC